MMRSVGGLLHVDELVADGRVERFPPPAVHAEPKPPVANGQPVGRRELVALVSAGVSSSCPGWDRPVRPPPNRVFRRLPAHPTGT